MKKLFILSVFLILATGANAQEISVSSNQVPLTNKNEQSQEKVEITRVKPEPVFVNQDSEGRNYNANEEFRKADFGSRERKGRGLLLLVVIIVVVIIVV